MLLVTKLSISGQTVGIGIFVQLINTDDRKKFKVQKLINANLNQLSAILRSTANK